MARKNRKPSNRKPTRKSGNRGKKNNRGRQNQNQQNRQAAPRKLKEGPITYRVDMTVKDFADALGIGVNEVIKKAMELGLMATQNQTLQRETVELLALEYDKEVVEDKSTDPVRFELIEEEEDESKLQHRPPVVTVMGHVDHGKTTLLDTIRNARVTAGEAGGITQHIGAYQYEKDGGTITFIDTPGHEAFTEMRARGAQITDIVVLVVAADDGIMPQTREAIDHAKAAGCPIIVAINKMDMPGANPERIKQELTEFELLPEEWGGQTIVVEISALQGEGIEQLLEMILLTAEVEEFKANPDREASGTVVESVLDKGRGPVATLLVRNGTLKQNETLVVGTAHGRVRAMTDDRGRQVDHALPSQPVEIIGLSDVPQAGDPFKVFDDEKTARRIAEERAEQALKEARGAGKATTLEEMFSQLSDSDAKELRIIVRGDTHGSIEALKSSLEKIDVEGADIDVIRASVGTITETDITLADASGAVVLGFGVRPAAAVRDLAKEKGVEIRTYSVIYRAIEDIEKALKGLLDPEFEEVVTGQAEVRDIFKISRIGTIAGCYVTNGKITRDANVRVLRDGVVVYEGELASLKRFKDDAKEVSQGYECGIRIDKFNDVKTGDVIEASIMKEVPRDG